MPVEIAVNGRARMRGGWRPTIIVTGLDPNESVTDRGLWVGYTASSEEPEQPSDLNVSKWMVPLDRGGPGTIITMSYSPTTFLRLVVRADVPADLFAGLTAASYVWVGITPTDDAAEPFDALAGPFRFAG